MQLEPEVKAELQKRLRRIEGQVRGIAQMLDDDRHCRDVITQVSAASKALDQVGFRILVTGLAECLNDPERAAAAGFEMDEVEKLFLRLA
jgi:DNA-binding FrmR family transcriptional regulator